MRIEDFPRPPADNGRGVHWSAWTYHNVIEPNLDYWIDELAAMQIKWVKPMDDGGGSSFELCRKLLAAGIMPVVRIFMTERNPSYMRSRQLDTVGRLIDLGVRYFESNNEPDLPDEWRDHRLPPNWLDIVVDNFIRDADAVLARGGYLALPAMGPGSRDNPISVVLRKGRLDLFERGCWVAIHNYTLNHPLNYPYDDANQLGQPLTREEFDQYARWAYSHLTYDEIVRQGLPVSREDYAKFNQWAWDGRSLEMVNQLRAATKKAGSTVFTDPNCFRGFEAAGKMIYDALGFYVPVISTEGGPVMGWGDDNRYPKVNPTTQMQWQVDIMRFMQTQAPPWYFSCCTWLLASRPLGDHSPTWEQMSWYTHAWDSQFGLYGQLPVVQALKDEPSIIRAEVSMGDGVIEGLARLASGQPSAGLRLRLQGEQRDAPLTTDANGAFRFAGLAAGLYRILAGETVLASDVVLAEGERKSITLSLGSGQQSAITGQVADVTGRLRPRVAIALHTGQQTVAAAQSDSEGLYRFGGLPAGSYQVSVEGASVAGIRLDGWNSQAADLTLPEPPGYRYFVAQERLLDSQETGNERRFYGRVLDQAGNGLNGVLVEMAWHDPEPGARFPRQTTPKDFSKPAGNFEFLHSPGEFLLRVVQGDWPSEEAGGLKTIGIAGREGEPITYEVDFQLRPVGGGGSGRVAGVIARGAGLGLTLRLAPSAGQVGRRSWSAVLPADGSFAFEGLPAGQYDLELEGRGSIGDLALAEGASAAVNYVVEDGGPTTGALAGVLSLADGAPAAGRRMLLFLDGAYLGDATTDAAGQFRFASLQPGRYRLDVEGLGVVAEGVNVISGETTALSLTLPEPALGSTVHGVLSYSDGQPAADLALWAVDEGGELFATRSGAEGSYTLSELHAGVYSLFVEHPQQGQVLLRADLALDGQSTLQLDFDQLTPLSASDGARLPSYILFGDLTASGLLVKLALPYLRDGGLTAGFSVSEAQRATAVVIVGGEDLVSAADEQALRAAGCQVQRLPGDLFDLAQVWQL